MQSQQLQLQKTNAELQEKAQLLAEQKTEVETKNQEVEQAKKALEEKAEQLALTSKYKSEFLANMSHELRTPLNNLLILARMLSENSDKNLSAKQVKFAETIHTSGTDLLSLISDILDLSKIESGKMDVEVGGIRFSELEDYCLRTFRHVADGKGLDFTVELGANLAPEIIHTDAKRLQQVLKNLLSNALKFTEQGSVRLSIDKVTSGWSPANGDLEPREIGDRVFGVGYRHRHRIGKAAHHLRSVPASRRNHQPQVRRHGSGAFHQPRAGAAAGWRDPVAERARRGQHVHLVSAANLRHARRAAQERGAAHHAAGAAGTGGEGNGGCRRGHDSAGRPRWPPKSWWRIW